MSNVKSIKEEVLTMFVKYKDSYYRIDVKRMTQSPRLTEVAKKNIINGFNK